MFNWFKKKKTTSVELSTEDIQETKYTLEVAEELVDVPPLEFEHEIVLDSYVPGPVVEEVVVSELSLTEDVYMSQEKITVQFVKTHEAAKAPFKGSADAACSDVFSVQEVILESGRTVVVDTGLQVAYIPQGYRIAVYSRSGLAAKNSVCVLNAPGVIDSDYRGNIKVILHNNNPGFMRNETLRIAVGDRIAQIALEKIETNYEFGFVDSVTDHTERGAGGLGSTGTN
jgi:dUTP pyrophosphatase